MTTAPANGEDLSFVFKNERPSPNRRLKVAAIVGHTTPYSSRLWFRTGAMGKYTVLYLKQDNNKSKKYFARIKHKQHWNLNRKDMLNAGIRLQDFQIQNDYAVMVSGYLSRILGI